MNMTELRHQASEQQSAFNRYIQQHGVDDESDRLLKEWCQTEKQVSVLEKLLNETDQS